MLRVKLQTSNFRQTDQVVNVRSKFLCFLADKSFQEFFKRQMDKKQTV